MLPLKDERTTQKIPFVTVFLIFINLFVFGFELSLPPEEFETFITSWGFVPANLLAGNFYWALVTVFTSIFIHGGLLHVGGNMLYLWVFGDNIEEALGSFNFLIFYFLAGVAGSFAQFAVYPASRMPMVGASGAVAGVLGAYLLLFPGSRILTAVIFLFFIRLVYLPAWLLLGFWILIQFFHGFLSLGVATGGGVAWFAHIGGFLAGIFLLHILKNPKKIIDN